jgi:hypothetical protein
VISDDQEDKAAEAAARGVSPIPAVRPARGIAPKSSKDGASMMVRQCDSQREKIVYRQKGDLIF